MCGLTRKFGQGLRWGGGKTVWGILSEEDQTQADNMDIKFMACKVVSSQVLRPFVPRQMEFRHPGTIRTLHVRQAVKWVITF